ncbi:MAG: hypothetical protein IPL72_00860 [Sulfuritalea sp.]|nr:hypothetical protein [Sulfuritalea sp.]
MSNGFNADPNGTNKDEVEVNSLWSTPVRVYFSSKRIERLMAIGFILGMVLEIPVLLMGEAVSTVWDHLMPIPLMKWTFFAGCICLLGIIVISKQIPSDANATFSAKNRINRVKNAADLLLWHALIFLFGFSIGVGACGLIWPIAFPAL